MVILKWKSLLNLRTRILLLTLILNLMLPSIALTSKKSSGTFKTETIRQLWQACSVAHQNMSTPQHIYYRLCDCAVDVMRTNYDNVTKIQKMSLEESKQFAVLIRLNCNDYRFEADEDTSS